MLEPCLPTDAHLWLGRQQGPDLLGQHRLHALPVGQAHKAVEQRHHKAAAGSDREEMGRIMVG